MAITSIANARTESRVPRKQGERYFIIPTTTNLHFHKVGYLSLVAQSHSRYLVIGNEKKQQLLCQGVVLTATL